MRKNSMGTGRRRSLIAVTVVALLLPANLGFVEVGAPLTSDTPAAGSTQDPSVAGTPGMNNLEHVFNFNPQDHDPDRHPSVGSDLEFFSHTVPLRDYETGGYLNKGGKPLPSNAKAEPIMAERDFAVMGSYMRGAYIFDITDPEAPQFVTQVECRQERNDVAIKKFTEKDGTERVVLALTQQTGDPCGGNEPGGIGLIVDDGPFADFYKGLQWAGTPAVGGETGQLVYAGTGCTIASYLPVAEQIQGNIALVIGEQSDPYNPADRCPAATFFQKVRAAQAAGAIGFIQIPGVNADGSPRQPNGNATAINADIPALEIYRTEQTLAMRDAVAGRDADGEVVDPLVIHGTLDADPGAPVIGEGSGGIGVFDITDPYDWEEMYRLRTGYGGVHNFIFHPTEPYGYVANGALPGGINTTPIIDFTDLDNPVVLADRDTTEGGPHDIEFSIDGNRAYSASENNYRIYDTTDPAQPKLISRTPNVGSYAHGVFPSPDGELMVTNNESIVIGGFLAPGTCPGEGLAVYDISNEGTPVGPLSYYAPQVVGPTDTRACTSHFGRFAPGTRVMSIGWYMAGVRVVDFSNPANPVEVAGAVMEGADTWAAKFHEGGYVYAGDRARGFDVFKWVGDGPAPWTVQTVDNAEFGPAAATISTDASAPPTQDAPGATGGVTGLLGGVQGPASEGTIQLNCRIVAPGVATTSTG